MKYGDGVIERADLVRPLRLGAILAEGDTRCMVANGDDVQVGAVTDPEVSENKKNNF